MILFLSRCSFLGESEFFAVLQFYRLLISCFLCRCCVAVKCQKWQRGESECRSGFFLLSFFQQSKALDSDVATLITLILWELIPTGLIISLFWKVLIRKKKRIDFFDFSTFRLCQIPATGRARFQANLATPADDRQYVYHTLASDDDEHAVFSNPLRYDSDNDLLADAAAADLFPASSFSNSTANNLLAGEPAPRYGSINHSEGSYGAYSPYNTTPFGRVSEAACGQHSTPHRAQIVALDTACA